MERVFQAVFLTSSHSRSLVAEEREKQLGWGGGGDGRRMWAERVEGKQETPSPTRTWPQRLHAAQTTDWGGGGDQRNVVKMTSLHTSCHQGRSHQQQAGLDLVMRRAGNILFFSKRRGGHLKKATRELKTKYCWLTPPP